MNARLFFLVLGLGIELALGFFLGQHVVWIFPFIYGVVQTSKLVVIVVAGLVLAVLVETIPRLYHGEFRERYGFRNQPTRSWNFWGPVLLVPVLGLLASTLFALPDPAIFANTLK